MRKVLLLSFLLVASLSLVAQEIRLENPSFEGDPQDATVPTGWMPCEYGTTPDILPGPWGVYTEASDGETYIGLISRADGSYESIGQRLSDKVEKGECYSLKIDLARSNTYTGYNKPLRIRIWGAYARCQKAQLLGESDLIRHTDWEEYQFNFTPRFDYHYIIIEAFTTEQLWQGNILLDNCSKIKKCVRA